MVLVNNCPKKDIFYLLDKYRDVISRQELEILLQYLLNCTKLQLYLGAFISGEDLESRLDSLIKRRISGEPIQYITGIAEFMGLDFMVSRGVFIPRPETELLVEEVLRSSGCFSSISILDLCTGSGNIGISMAKLMPCIKVIATDVSGQALETARKNSLKHKVDNRIKFYQGNLFDALIIDKKQKFDIIGCNPPYIKEQDLDTLQKEIMFEPEIALNGGKDGLDFYRRIADSAHRYLNKKGAIILELGFGQAQEVMNIFSGINIYKIQEPVKDFAGIERVLWINL